MKKERQNSNMLSLSLQFLLIAICTLPMINCDHKTSKNMSSSSSSLSSETQNNDDKIQIWQINSYGGVDELKLAEKVIPIDLKSNDVLVKIEASSVNPLDTMMTRGYGKNVLNLLRSLDTWSFGSEFPLTVGRDFSGIVVAKGNGVSDDKLMIGDKVWGVVSPEKQGCHSTHIIIDKTWVTKRPINMTYIESASVIYAGLTAWSAMWFTGGLKSKVENSKQNGMKILILGGSGGVGSMAIQIAKSWNLRVITTCSPDAVKIVEKLGADVVINYRADDADEKIKNEGKYDIILDAANQGLENVQKKGIIHKIFISLNSPLLNNTDKYGVVFGGITSLWDLFKYNMPGNNNKGWYKWGFFTPSPEGIAFLKKLVDNNQLVSIVQEVYSFKDTPKAYERVDKGHLRGKIVIDMKHP